MVEIDFETYSDAGFVGDGRKWRPLPGAREKGLKTVGMAKYSEHPSTEVLCLAYKIGDEIGQWLPGQPPPQVLFDYIAQGGLIEAWNCGFEGWIWRNVCVKKYGWPELPRHQLRDAAAKTRAWALPGHLADAGEVLDVATKKDKDGKRLIRRFCIPRDVTQKDNRLRIFPELADDDTQRLYRYNVRDIEAESAISGQVPDLLPDELKTWLCDQDINFRGVQVDEKHIKAAIEIVNQALIKYNQELNQITGGTVKTAAQTIALAKWLGIPNVNVDTVSDTLKRDDLNPNSRRALEIRQLISSASVKKLYAMQNQITADGRLHDLFIYHAARTGRAAGTGPQPQNLPNHGPNVWLCGCGKHYVAAACPWCGSMIRGAFVEWNERAVLDALETIATGSLALMEYHWGDALAVISGCLRAMFISAPGKDLIGSDYAAIEAVVLAALAGEEWRLEVFRTHGKIYEVSASKITGVPFSEFEKHYRAHGTHHPLRKSIGKVAELASGYQGWLGAWKQFGADEFFNDDEEMKEAILAWRAASPKIVEMWGNLENAAKQAVTHKEQPFYTNRVTYVRYDNILYCFLPSGRYLTYHNPRLEQSDRGLSLSYEGWNTNPKMGGLGWIRINTFGGRLTENVVQAVARDILMHGLINLEAAGYPIVLHVHDEALAEIKEGWGSVTEFEAILSILPKWCKDWPVKARGGWRGKRYRK